MESEAVIRDTVISGSGDKGISVGEGSRAFIFDSRISNSAIGIESKDGSNVSASQLSLISNATQLSAYRKNWRYGEGGEMHIKKSQLSGSENQLNVQKRSRIRISESNLFPKPTYRKTSHQKRVQLDQDVTFNQNRSNTGG